MTRKAIIPVQGKHRVGEMAGGTAAECAAVCCCCPFAVVHFVVLAVYTVPKGLLKKAVMKRRKRQRLLNDSTTNGNDKNNDVVPLQHMAEIDNMMSVSATKPLEEKEPATEAVALENQMWARFAGTGFWRSESQRQP